MKVLHLFLVLICTIPAAAQKNEPPPFKIRLLPGYRHNRLFGVDTTVGRISKRHGLIIEYDLGDLPVREPPRVRPPRNWNRQCKWIKDDDSSPTADTDINCKIDTDENGHKQTLFVHFPDGATFWAQVKNKQQISEMVRMVLTYDPS